jgi:hypothetical protein
VDSPFLCVVFKDDFRVVVSLAPIRVWLDRRVGVGVDVGVGVGIGEIVGERVVTKTHPLPLPPRESRVARPSKWVISGGTFAVSRRALRRVGRGGVGGRIGECYEKT